MKYLSTGLLRSLLLISLLYPVMSFAQTELVPVDNRIYPYLEMMSLKGLINYNSADIPISRRRVASYLNQLEKTKAKLSSTEQKILADFRVEFSYDISKSTKESFSLISHLPGGLLNIFNDDEQKYLVYYADPDFSLFLDGVGALSYRSYDFQRSPNANVSLLEIGPRLRGTLYDNVSFYIHVTEGQTFGGNAYARSVAQGYDPLLISSTKFVDNKYITAFNSGYLRWESDSGAVAVTLGRDNFELGDGYIDKLWVSNNMPPMDFARLDLNYKFFRYTFFYANLQGDSLGVPLNSKNLVGGYLSINLSPSFRFGLYQSLTLSNTPFMFSFFNPISVLESASLNTNISVNAKAMIGFDSEYRPCKDIGIQASFLMNDLNFSTLGNKSSPIGNDNKFGYQLGMIYAEPFGIRNLTAKLEYTLLDPFVYTSRTNMNNYTNWGTSIGTQLPPNSDQIALEMDYWLTNRITLNLLYEHQRSGEGFLDANGKPTLNDMGPIIRNFGGDINRGDLDFAYVNNFLQGLRVNRDIVAISARYEPIRQYYIDLYYSLQSIDSIYESQTDLRHIFYVTISTDF